MLAIQQNNVKKQNSSMEFLSKIMPMSTPKEGDIVEGEFLTQLKNAVFVDLRPYGTGIIYGREFNNARELIRPLKPGDVVSAKIVSADSETGYVELSLKEAGREILWKEAQEARKNQTVFSLPVTDANKGGLIFEWKGLQGFLPASQLKTGHYPRVEGGDKDKILDELKKLVGEKLSVAIIDADPKENKLIFSEKETEAGAVKDIIAKYKIGDVVEGEITGMVDFGIFIKIEEGLEGLAHISELDWGLVEDPSTMFQISQKVPAQIIAIKDDKISLSLKALKYNPWEGAKNKYRKNETAKGVVIRFNKYGALVSLEEGVAGLVHISEFISEEDMKNKLELGKSYEFKITLLDADRQKLLLSFNTSPDSTDKQKETGDKTEETENKQDEKNEKNEKE